MTIKLDLSEKALNAFERTARIKGVSVEAVASDALEQVADTILASASEEVTPIPETGPFDAWIGRFEGLGSLSNEDIDRDIGEDIADNHEPKR